MLRSVKSTQRKVRQLELIIKETGGALSVAGPAKRQVKSIAQSSGVISIELEEKFKQEPVMVAISSKADSKVLATSSGKLGGAGADKLQITHVTGTSAADLDEGQIHLLIVGSDTAETY